MTNVEALQALYAALGGTPANVANASTSVEVLNAIAALYDGEDDAIINPDAIANIAAVAGSITPEPATLIEKSVSENGTYNAEDDEADGYSSVNVEVPVGLVTPTLFETRATSKTGPTAPCAFVDSSKQVCLFFTDVNGVAEISDDYSGQSFSASITDPIIIGDVKKIDATIEFSTTVTFKAATDFEGIYINDTKITETGDEIVSGNWYTVILEKMGTTLSATVSGDSDYTRVITIE